MSKNPLGLLVRPGCPPFSIVFPDGHKLYFGNPAESDPVNLENTLFTLYIKTRRVLKALRWNPSLGFARGYISGEIEFVPGEGKFIPAGSVTINDLLSLYWRYFRLSLPALVRVLCGTGWWWLKYQRRLRRDSPELAQPDIQRHYDLPLPFYQGMLGATMAYSCAIFYKPGVSLDQAQQYKINQTLAWLNLGQSDDILYVGCGFGALELNGGLQRAPQARWYGITHSQEQDHYIFSRQFNNPELQRFDVRLADWRQLAPGAKGRPTKFPYLFDKIVSLGQLEHVPRYERQDYFDLMYTLLKPGGIMVLQTIVKPEWGIPDPWIATDIFPLGDIPWQAHLDKCLKRAGYTVKRRHNYAADYARTLSHWRANCLALPESIWQAAAQRRGLTTEQFKRLWVLYLVASKVAFEMDKLNLVRYQLIKPK